MPDPLAELAEATRLLTLALERQTRAIDLLQAARKAPVEDAFQPTFTSVHRRLHRPHRPPKIDLDPELQAFIPARIDHMTFVELEAAVAARFPPERNVGKSAIHQWWRKARDPNG